MPSFEETLARMKGLYTYGQELNEDKRTPNCTLEYHKQGADGVNYGIVKECSKYYIKSAPKGKENIAEAYDYLGGFCNKKNYEYTSYANALKHFKLKLASINEACDSNVQTGNEENFMSNVLMTESTDSMRREIARQRQIMYNVSMIMNESSDINPKNVPVMFNGENPEAPKGKSKKDGKNVTANPEFKGTKTNGLKTKASPFEKEKKVNENCDECGCSSENDWGSRGLCKGRDPKKIGWEMEGQEVVSEECDDWGSEGLPGTPGVGEADTDRNNTPFAKNVNEEEDPDLDDIELSDDEDYNVEDDNYVADDSEDTDIEDTDMEDTDMADTDFDGSDIEGDDVDDTDMGNSDIEGDDVEDTDMGNSDIEGDDVEDTDTDIDFDFGDENDEPSDDIDINGDEDNFDSEEDDFDTNDDFDSNEDFLNDDNEDFDGEMPEDESDDDIDYNNDSFESDEDDFDNELPEDGYENYGYEDNGDDLDDEIPEDESEGDIEECGFEECGGNGYNPNAMMESKRRKMNSIVENVVNKILAEDELHVFGKHPGYRKKPFTLPTTGEDKNQWGEDWNDESVYSEAPFGEKIGDGDPFNELVQHITNDVLYQLKNGSAFKKKVK